MSDASDMTPSAADSRNPAVPARETADWTLPAGVLGMDAEPDGSRLYAACMDGVYELDTASGERRLLDRHDSYASGVVRLPDGDTLISAGYDGALHWIDRRRGRVFRRVHAHSFWSWKMAVSDDLRLVASVTGRYAVGGYRYEPAPSEEPAVRVWDTHTGEAVHAFHLLPPVLSVGFSSDGRHLAAGNMMGDLRVWSLESGRVVADWNTPDFTSWGVIKSHHYIGGVFDIAFDPVSGDVLACGMGPMRDPMAGNGHQTWERFDWRAAPPRQTGAISEGDRGRGLMETLAFAPDGSVFVMAGRMAQGNWNLAFFDRDSGRLIQGIDNKMRVTRARFSSDGRTLWVAGARGQPKRKDGAWPEFGRLLRYEV